MKSLSAEKFKASKINGEIYYCFQKVCLMSNQGWVKIVAYHRREDLLDELVILVSNRLDWDEPKVISIYQWRCWNLDNYILIVMSAIIKDEFV